MKATQLALQDDGLTQKGVQTRLNMYELPTLIWDAYQQAAIKERKLRWFKWGLRLIRNKVGLPDPVVGLAEVDEEPVLSWNMYADEK